MRKEEVERMKLRRVVKEKLEGLEVEEWKGVLEVRRRIMVWERLVEG